MPYVVYERTYDPMPLFPSHGRPRRLCTDTSGCASSSSANCRSRWIRTLGGLASTILVRADAYAQEVLRDQSASLAMVLLLAPLERSGWMLLALLDLRVLH